MKFKLLLTMKLIVLLSLVLSLDVTASVYGQRIDLRMENASLESVLMEVQRQSNYNFLFNARYLKKARPVTVRSEEHTSELQSLMRIPYAVFCLKKKKNNKNERKISIKQIN